MYLCELYNLSVGIPAYKLDNLIYTDDGKTVKGIVGKEFQLFLQSRKNYPNYCNLKNIYNVGSKLENGSYDGALGAIDKQEIDLYFRSEVPFTDNQNIHLSYPVNSEEFFVYQIINKKNVDDFENKMQLIKSFNMEFLQFYFLAAFSFVMFFIFFYFLSSTKTNQLKISTVTKTFKRKKFKKFRLIYLGLILFDFLTKQIMSNNIKTSKIVVDTSQLIITEKDLFESPLKAGWFEGESDFTVVKNAPKNTFLNNLYELKNENPIKFFDKNFNLTVFSQMNNYFFFVKNYFLQIGINLLSDFQSGDGFSYEKPFYSIFTSFYISKLIAKEKIKFIYKLSQFAGQTGYSLQFVNRSYNNKLFNGPKKNKFFRTLESYTTDYTKFDSLKLENFFYFFLFFLAFQLLNIFFFFFHLFFDKIFPSLDNC